MPKTTAQKAALRRELLADRQAIPPEVRAAMDAAIGERVAAWWETQRPAMLGVYWPIRGEPDLRAAYEALCARGARLALPVVVGKDAPLSFIEWKPGDAMTKDGFGVAIPVTGATVQPAALLIPCVGFNAQRYRLGYGGGFYDRTLAAAKRPLAIGIAYECARTEFPSDVHDVALDAIITEAMTN
ncbi:MAG TPA: 5-formyltetrahydrofolate cyclo-ligase [Noviherbaspirillum sp.]|uniref:5-formyltetrahydrofolate cyclo-ligase n=1 Tax=Noviherbaspirillum sp. TaxID=1926288 RepID=UPI002D282FF3|nr:5-formyltetrahydrofolate cyclo-ligase [Noviherbaspirillum sp.]HYD96475.1 5-formyltetrahydrofolate cyclo-ligase [Noviherbaspirillum sp.]